MTMTEASIPVRFERLRAFIAAALERLDLPAADALAVATLMAEADLQGSDGHGVMRLPQYAQRIKAGGVNPRPAIRVAQERAGMALIDGDNGMGHLVMQRAAQMAIEKARVTGIAYARDGIPLAAGLMRRLNQLAAELGIAELG